MSVPLRWAAGDVCLVDGRLGRVQYVTATYAWVVLQCGGIIDPMVQVRLADLDLALPELPKEDA